MLKLFSRTPRPSGSQPPQGVVLDDLRIIRQLEGVYDHTPSAPAEKARFGASDPATCHAVLAARTI